MIKKTFLCLILLLFWSNGQSQNLIQADSITFSASIFDSENKEVLPYCTIYNQTKEQGTISNLNGEFTLKNNSLDDYITISFLGYKRKTFNLSSEKIKVIYLKPSNELLNSVTVLADNNFLYDIILSCKTKKNNAIKTAKTYYALKSSINEEQVELVESYYNGHYSNNNLFQLDLKNGRIALLDLNNHFFVSTESSRTFYMHKLNDNNKYFPISPFQFNKKKLKKNYTLSLVSKFKDENLNTIYSIKFIKRKKDIDAFDGTVWIDSLNRNIIKVNLTIENTKSHPFLNYGNIDSLSNINLNLTKEFAIINNESFIKSIDFDYSIDYITKNDSMFTVNTNAIIYAYNYTKPFILPKFSFYNNSYEDYRKINALPYNSFFWDNYCEFNSSEFVNQNKKFVNERSVITSEKLFLNNSYFEKGIFESPYIFWSKNRIMFKEEIIKEEYLTGKTPSERYYLEAQLFLDINLINDSLDIITATIFDPTSSFYYYQMTNQGLAFINMYFDLVEIYRIKLEREIKNLQEPDSIMNTYSKITTELKNTSDTYFREVQHGTEMNKMHKWNNYILNNLGINNFTYFSIK